MENAMNWLRGAIRSRTIWFNGLLAAALPYSDQLMQGAHDNLPEISQYLPADMYKTIGLIIVVVNLILRTRTAQSLSSKGKS